MQDANPGNGCMEGGRQWVTQAQGVMKQKLGEGQAPLKRQTGTGTYSVCISAHKVQKHKASGLKKSYHCVKSTVAHLSVCKCW